MAKEVKDDVVEDEIEAFEKAEEAGEVKTGEERELDTENSGDKSDDEPEDGSTEEAEETEENSNESEDDVDVEPSTTEIKEVAGETPREKALRLEVTRLRKKGREKEEKDLLATEKTSEPDSYEELKELGYDEDQINTLDKAFDIIGKKKGFVRKDQSYATMANDTLAEFVEEHPEYSAENDKDDVYWGRFKTILKDDYKLANKTSKQLKSIFNRVDREIKEELGENVVDKKVTAQKQKIKSASAGTSTSKSDKPVNKVVQNNKVVSNHPGLIFKGFDDDEVEEFTK